MNIINLKSLGILDVYYGKGMDRKEHSFILMTSEDGIIYYKKINWVRLNVNQLIYANYFTGIEADILKYLGNEDWYSYNKSY